MVRSVATAICSGSARTLNCLARAVAVLFRLARAVELARTVCLQALSNGATGNPASVQAVWHAGFAATSVFTYASRIRGCLRCMA